MGTVLVGDVGGTSSRWAMATAQHAVRLRDGAPWPGYNAATGDPRALIERLREGTAAAGPPERVLVHAAGCGTPERAVPLATQLEELFAGAQVEVGSDLLGAARSAWGDAPGLVLIAGTGMNAGCYDGRRLVAGIPSLGWVLGDEGGGADIGKALLRDALRDRMPARVRAVVFGDGPVLPEVIARLYRQPDAASWAAAPVARLHQVRDEPYVRELLAERFGALAAEVHRVLGAGEVRAVGSVAAGFREALADALRPFGLVLTAAVADPLPGLVTYVRTTMRP